MVSAIRKLMQTLRNQMAEVQDRTGKEVKKIYEISRHDRQVVKNKDARWDQTFAETRGFTGKKGNVTVVSERITAPITAFLGDKTIQLMTRG